jgi:hypothetical protein
MPYLTSAGAPGYGIIGDVIKRLDLTSQHRPWVTWPESPDVSRSGYLYDGRKPYRKVRVMIDFDALTDGASGIPTREDLLAQLLDRDLVEMLRYRDDGPPAELTPDVDHGYIGWAVVQRHLHGNDYGVDYSTARSTAT